MRFTIRNNRLMQFSCGPSATSFTRTIVPSPEEPVADGAFLLAASGAQVSGRIVTATTATGLLRIDACFGAPVTWFVQKR